MTAVQFIAVGPYFIAALLSGLAVALFLATLVHAESRFGTWVQPAIVPAIALGICASSLLSGRSLQNAAFDLNLATEGISPMGSMILRLITLAILGVCVGRIGGQWFRRHKAPDAWGTSLFIAFFAVYLTHNVLSSIFGTEPTFIHNLLYPIVVFAAVYAARREPLETAITGAKLALYVMMLLSLVAAIVKPDLALQSGYKGWVPGISVRLWGVGSNANSIGPLALVVLLIEYMQPTQQKWLRWPAVMVTLAVFVLAQSKTVWFASILLLPVLAWYRIEKPKSGLDVRVILGAIFTMSLALLALLVFDPASAWEKVAASRAGGDISTLSGRGQVWAVAVTEWLKNPIFGYGPEIWGPAFRQHIGMQFAFSAHNQFLQSLSSAGGLGFISLLLYLWMFGVYAMRAATGTKGVSVALLFLVLIRSMTETPLAMNTLFNGELLVHLLMFQIAIRGALVTSPIPPRFSATHTLLPLANSRLASR